MPDAAAHASLPAPGQLLLGKYRVERVLGEGGMGVVLAAVHVQLGEPVAIKLLHPELGLSGARYARFVREARAASSIRSEHVVRVYDLGALEDGAPYIAMELLQGTDLASLVATRGALPIADAVDYVLQACDGVAEAHARQIVHRDLKPANLFLTHGSDGSPCVKVLDFGISKVGDASGSSSDDDAGAPPGALGETVEGSSVATDAPVSASARANASTQGWDAASSLTRTRSRLGSPRYMSPEQTRSAKHVDARADVWALGTILYELLTGAHAFDAETSEVLVHRITSTEPQSVRAARPEVPERLEEVVSRCLRKKADERFADVGELATALAPFASAEGAASAVRAARILRRAEGGRSIPPPRVDALAETVDASGGSKTGAPSRLRRWAKWTAAIVAGLAVVSLGIRTGVDAWLRARARRSAAEAGGSRMSTNPDAVAAYETGMRAMRDGSLSTAAANLERATALDPTFAAAHLGRAFVEAADWEHAKLSVVQEHLLLARASRDSVGERDKLLFDGFEPWASTPPSLKESEVRLGRAADEHPFDATLRFAYAVVLDAANSPDAYASADRALALDPSFAMAWDVVAHLRQIRDVPGAIEAENACLRISPGADTCLWRLAVIQSASGKCADLKGTIQRILSVTPSSARAYQFLAGALAANGEPLESVRFALEKRWSLLPPSETEVARAEDEGALAILSGDLVDAEAKYKAFEGVIAADPTEAAHFPATYGRMLAEVEMGRNTDAAAAAEAYLARRPAWSKGTGIPRTISIYALQRTAGAISQARYEELRDQWLKDETERRRSTGNIPAPDYGWTLAYTQPVRTKDEAVGVLATRGPALPFFEIGSWEPDYDEWIGRVYFLAGRLDEGASFLERASRSCEVVLPRQTLFVVRATAELGEALEAKGDGAGACAAYSRFLSRWGHARVSPPLLAEVETRAKALRCGSL